MPILISSKGNSGLDKKVWSIVVVKGWMLIIIRHEIRIQPGGMYELQFSRLLWNAWPVWGLLTSLFVQAT